MKLRDRLILGGLLVALVAVGAALVVRMPSDSAGASASVSVSHTPYREGIVGHPSSVTPLTWRTQADQDLVALLFRGLVKAGPGGTVVPDLAQSWNVSTDGRIFTFNIRPNAYWEDGVQVTSADVVFTIGLLQDGRYDGPIGSSWQGIRTSSDGPLVVKFTMTLPIAGFLRQAELPLLPAHLLKGMAANKLADSSFSSHPIGNGPYRLVSMDDERAVLERVESVKAVPLPTPSPTPFASAAPSTTPTPVPTPSPTATTKLAPGATIPPTPAPTNTPAPSPTPTAPPTATPPPVPAPSGFTLAEIQNIEFYFYDDATTAAQAYSAGKLEAVGGLTPDATDSAAKRTSSRIVPYRWGSLLSVVLNQRSDHPEMRDANTRTGLLEAINRADLLNEVLEGRGTPADLPVPNWSSLYDSTSVTPASYDIFESEGFLATAGWVRSNAGWTAPKGKAIYTLELLTTTEASNPVLYRTAQQVAASWTAIGLNVTIDAVTTSTYISRLNDGDFTAAVTNFEVGLDPDLGPMLLSSQIGLGGSNVSGVNDQTLDQLVLTARKAATPADRKVAMSAVEKYVSTTLPILPLCFRDYDLVVSNRVQQLVSNDISDPSGRFWDVLDWRLASDR